jgi:hypothetical protein
MDMIAALARWRTTQAVPSRAAPDMIAALAMWQASQRFVEARRTDFTYHPDCTLCCQMGRCHWCLGGHAGRVTYNSGGAVIAGEGPPLIADSLYGYTYWMCANHIRYFRTASRGRSVDPHAGTGFDPYSPVDRYNAAQGVSPLLHIPTQKQRELEP